MQSEKIAFNYLEKPLLMYRMNASGEHCIINSHNEIEY